MKQRKNLTVRKGAGRGRDAWRIREWMNRKGYTVVGIAKELGVDQSLVSHTIHGRQNNRRTLAKLVELGCPVGHLSLPKDMQGDEAA